MKNEFVNMVEAIDWSEYKPGTISKKYITTLATKS